MSIATLLFSSKGRISRKTFILVPITLSISITILGLILGKILGAATAGIITNILLIPLIIITVILTIKRFHDLDKSGWLVLAYMFVPIYNIYLWGILVFCKGSESSNQYNKNLLTSNNQVNVTESV